MIPAALTRPSHTPPHLPQRLAARAYAPSMDGPWTAAEIWHLARADDWHEAQGAGAYTASSRGVSLAQEGFIHCSYPHQLAQVAQAFYADDPGPLLVLVIDPSHLGGAQVRVEALGTQEAYPHIYGPIPVAAVTRTHPAGFAADGQFRVARAVSEGAIRS